MEDIKMKKLILLLAAAFVFSGCTKTTEVHQVYPPETTVTSETVRTPPKNDENPLARKDIPVKVRVHDAGISYIETSSADKNKTFFSADELSAFVEEVIEPNYPNGVPPMFSEYDDAFFKDHILFYTAHTYPTCSAYFAVDEATSSMYYGSIELNVPVEIPMTSLDGEAYFCFFAEFEKEDVGVLNGSMVKLNHTAVSSSPTVMISWYHAPDGQVNDCQSHYEVIREGDETRLSIVYAAANGQYIENSLYRLTEEHAEYISSRVSYFEKEWHETSLTYGNSGDYFSMQCVDGTRIVFLYQSNDKGIPVEINDFINELELIAMEGELINRTLADGTQLRDEINYQ